MSHRFAGTSINTPSIIGAGLACLDIIRTSGDTRYYNGGSCGNVVSALSFLGWKASVITGSYADVAGKIFAANLIMLGVNQVVVNNSQQETPRIVENLITMNNCYVDHKYLLSCPECGKKLPSAKPLGETAAKTITSSAINHDVFYTDRSSPGLKMLRSLFKDKGAWTVFEPNSARNIAGFYSNALDSHIVKFSKDRISFDIAERLRKLARKGTIVLIVHTAGSAGLYYSYRKRDKEMSDWHHLTAQPISRFADASGAGDWTTTGLLAGLIKQSRMCRKWLSREDVVASLQYGQALAAISCAFIGAQGLFYADINAQVENKRFKIKRRNVSKIEPVHVSQEMMFGHCGSCLSKL